jgi:hypothetical protein
MVDGKSAESWTNYDVMSMMRQLGVLPTLGQPARPATTPLHG